MTVKQVAIRLKPEGGGEVVRAFKDLQTAGVNAEQATTAATLQAIAAQDRQLEKTRQVQLAMSQPVPGVQSRIDQITGVTGGTNARAAVAAPTLYAANDDYERRASALRAVIDPLGAAQDRLNAELAEYRQLAHVGAISSKELAEGQALAKSRFDATTAAIGRQAGGLSRLQVASRLNLARQGADVAVTAAMGMNPAMIAIQQGPQILDALATSGIKAQASMLLLGGAVTAVAAGVAVLGVAYMNGEANALQLERATAGLGRASGVTAGELEALALAAADQGRISVASARDQAAAYISTGKIGRDVMVDLIAIGRDYASVFGLEAEDATQSLAKAMSEPDKAARELTRQIGLMDQATLDHIDSLVKLGQREAAQQILITALNGAVAGHADKVSGLAAVWDDVARAASNAWDMISQALYLTQDERIADLERTLGRSRLSPWVRQGAESDLFVETQLRDWSDRTDADRARAAAANQAQQEATDRRNAAPKPRSNRSAEAAAERAARQAERRREQEEDFQTERAIQIARLVDDADRVRMLETENAVRDRTRQLVEAGAAGEAARTQALREQAELDEARAEATARHSIEIGRQVELEVMRALGEARGLEIVERRADLQARLKAYLDAGYDKESASNLAAADRLQIDLAIAAARERQAAASQLDHELNLARLSGDVARAEALDRQVRTRDRARDIEQQLGPDRGEGDGAAARQISQEIAAEANGVRRAWLQDFASDIRESGWRDAFADQMESASDRFFERMIDGFLNIDWGALMGGGQSGKGGGWADWISAGISFLAGGGKKIGKNANGTEFWDGGLTWVGERGKELVDLPRGARVIEHNRSMALAGAGGRGGGLSIQAVYAPNISVQGSGPEIAALRAELAQERAAFKANVTAAVNDGIARREIG